MESLHGTWQTLLDCTWIRNTRFYLTEKQTAIMVKKFSVDWLAQSFHEAAPTEAQEPEKKRHRPHVPCLAQPRPPTSYDKIYLQPKAKVAKVEQKPEVTGVPKEKEMAVPRHCSSPSISENSGYSSGYESEAATSECASVEDGHELEKEAVQRRIRTKFTPEQIDKLEKIFNKHKYLDAGERIKTALKMNLSETQVRTWFQNRRMKLKREVQEMQADYFLPALPQMVVPHMHAVQYHCYDRQRLQFHHHIPAQQMIPHQQIVSHHMMMMPQHYY